MILPENEFNHLKGVNKQPYLDIKSYPSHLTNWYFFSCFPLQYQEQLCNDQFLFSLNSTKFSTFIQ